MAEYVRGKILGGMLAKALNLPKNTKSFELRCAMNEIVTVKCEYFPDMDGIQKVIPVIKEYCLCDKDEVGQKEDDVNLLKTYIKGLESDLKAYKELAIINNGKSAEGKEN